MKEIICIVCPRGCHLLVDEATLKVTGNHCERGAAYGVQELQAPTRVLTSTVKLSGSSLLRRCPVKTSQPIPKGMMLAAAAALDAISVSTPVHVGQVLQENLLGTGANLVATRTIEE